MLSYWETTSVAQPTDYLIIGAGLSGLSIAWRLRDKYPYASIRILERGPFPFGASTRNAGFACFGSPSELLDDIDVDGIDQCLDRVEKRFQGLQFYLDNFDKDVFDYEACGGFEIFKVSESVKVEAVSEQLDYLNEAIREVLPSSPYSIDPNINRFGMNVHSVGFFNQLEGQLHPGKLCMAIENRLRRRGVDIRYGVEIEHLESVNDVVVCRDQNGIEWKGDRSVVATNGLTQKLLPEKNVVPARGQVILTEPIPALKVKGTFHYEEGYWYFRNVGDRLLLGGGRNIDLKAETTAARDTSSIIQEALESMVRNIILPDRSFKITHRWAGTMAFGSKNEKAPLIEALSDRIYLAARLGGMGVAMAPSLAKDMVSKL